MSESPEVPANVLANWQTWWPGQEQAIHADIHARLHAAIGAWQLSELRVISGGEVAFVLGAQSPHGPAVLKLSPRADSGGEELRDEARGLAAWAAAGAAVPAVYGLRDDGQTMLLERITPGVTLHERCSDPLATLATLGALARSLRDAEVDSAPFMRLQDSERMTQWRGELAGRREAAELERLLADSPPERLLHLDLHSKNALHRGAGEFAVIDPKPLLGDPHAEVFGFLFGTAPRALTGERRHDRELVCAMLRAYAHGLELERLAAWTRLRALTIYTWGLRYEPAWAAEMGRFIEALDR